MRGIDALLMLSLWILLLVIFWQFVLKSSEKKSVDNIVEIYGPRNLVLHAMAEVFSRNKYAIRAQDYKQILEEVSEQYSFTLGFHTYLHLQFQAQSLEAADVLVTQFVTELGESSIQCEIKII